METISLLARNEATERMSSAQNQVLAVLTTHSSFVTAFVAIPVCFRECTSDPFRHGALCPDCSFKAPLLKTRVDKSTLGPLLAPRLLDSSCFPDPSELAGSELGGYTTTYTPRMSYIRSTLLMIFGFHIRNLVRSWQCATLANQMQHPGSQQQHANATLEAKAVQHNRPEVWKRPFLTLTDVTPQDMSLGTRSHSDLMRPAPPAPISKRRMDELQEHNHRQLQSPPTIETSITEKAILTEEHAHKSMRQATESNYRAADAEDKWTHNTTIYDLHGTFYRQILPVSVRGLSKVSIKYESDKNVIPLSVWTIH